jgi:predicted RNase H-like HicB family nuclease
MPLNTAVRMWAHSSLRLYDCISTFSFRSEVAAMEFKIEVEREEDGRYLADIPELSGVMAYGKTKEEAIANAEALALRVIADRIELQKKGEKTIAFAGA